MFRLSECEREECDYNNIQDCGYEEFDMGFFMPKKGKLKQWLHSSRADRRARARECLEGEGILFVYRPSLLMLIEDAEEERRRVVELEAEAWSTLQDICERERPSVQRERHLTLIEPCRGRTRRGGRSEAARARREGRQAEIRHHKKLQQQLLQLQQPSDAQ